MSSAAEEIIKPVIKAAITSTPEASGSLFMKFIDWSIDMMFMMLKIFVMFTTMSVGMTYWNQEGMLYHPYIQDPKYRYPRNMPPGMRHPGEYSLEYEDCKIVAKDKTKLHAWFIKASTQPRNHRTMIFFHENAGNIGQRLQNIDIIVKRCNTNVLILAYRGYGDSEGTPSEDGLKLDADATLEYAQNHKDIDNDRIFVFGRSLGGAVAIQLAMVQSNAIKGLIVENTFTSIGDMVDQLMPLVAKFKGFIQRLFYPSIDRIHKVTAPILFVRGLKDEVVPTDHVQRLYDAATQAKFKSKHDVPEGNHNATWQLGGEEYITAFKTFFEKCDKEN